MVLRVVEILRRRLDGSLAERDGVLPAVLFYVVRAEVVRARAVGLGKCEISVKVFGVVTFTKST